MNDDELTWARQRAHQSWARSADGHAALARIRAAVATHETTHDNRTEAPRERTHTRRGARAQRTATVPTSVLIGAAASITGLLVGLGLGQIGNEPTMPSGFTPLSGNGPSLSLPAGTIAVVCRNDAGTGVAGASNTEEPWTAAARACPALPEPGAQTYAVCSTDPYLLIAGRADADACPGSNAPLARVRVNPDRSVQITPR